MTRPLAELEKLKEELEKLKEELAAERDANRMNRAGLYAAKVERDILLGAVRDMAMELRQCELRRLGLSEKLDDALEKLKE